MSFRLTAWATPRDRGPLGTRLSEIIPTDVLRSRLQRSFTPGIKPGACFRFVHFENRERAGAWPPASPLCWGQSSNGFLNASPLECDQPLARRLVLARFHLIACIFESVRIVEQALVATLEPTIVARTRKGSDSWGLDLHQLRSVFRDHPGSLLRCCE